jgi:photosystem II stability/assembly factor-like uncharacterized protein
MNLPKFVFLMVLVISPRAEAQVAQIDRAASATKPLAVTNDWHRLKAEPYPGKRDDISFATASHGWYGTGKGDLYATTDGGARWNLVTSQPGTFIRALAFLDETFGFIGNVGTDYYPGVQDENPLYTTNDGGKTWTAVDLGEETIKGVCSIDVVETSRIFQGKLVPHTVIHAAGRVGGPTGILRSIDRGKTWTVIDMTSHAGMILDIKFFDDMTGLVFASTARDETKEGLILRTTDGGATWNKVYQSGRREELVWKASFPTKDIGYATVQSYDPARAEQLIVKTTDRGLSWQELKLVENAAARQFGIGFVDPDHGWVGTLEGGFYTSDGGASFKPVAIAKAANKFRIVPTEAGVDVFAIGTEVQRLKLAR